MLTWWLPDCIIIFWVIYSSQPVYESKFLFFEIKPLVARTLSIRDSTVHKSTTKIKIRQPALLNVVCGGLRFAQKR